MKRAPERSAAARAIACFSCCLLLCFPSHAQDMPSPLDLMGTDFLSYVPIPADRLASYLLDGNELVADGEFFGFPQPTREELRANKAQKVRIHFRIHKLYKGPASGSIKIELTSDMLVFPGTKVSRYVTSALIQDRLRADLDPLHKQVDALKRSFEAKEIDRTKFDLEMNRLTAAMESANRERCYTAWEDELSFSRLDVLRRGWSNSPGTAISDRRQPGPNRERSLWIGRHGGQQHRLLGRDSRLRSFRLRGFLTHCCPGLNC